MLTSTRFKRRRGLDLTSFPLSHPHKIFSPKPFLPLDIVFKKIVCSFFKTEVENLKNLEIKIKRWGAHVKCITTTSNLRKSSKR